MPGDGVLRVDAAEPRTARVLHVAARTGPVVVCGSLKAVCGRAAKSLVVVRGLLLTAHGGVHGQAHAAHGQCSTVRLSIYQQPQPSQPVLCTSSLKLRSPLCVTNRASTSTRNPSSHVETVPTWNSGVAMWGRWWL